MIPASEMTQIQSDLAAAVCDKPCDLYAPVASTDAYGSPVNTYPTKTASTVCGMSQPSAGELANYDYEIGDKAAWTVRFPIATTVDKQWHAIVEGQTLEVHILLTPKSYPGLLSVIAVEIK